jgi:hypothetical protein
MNIVKIVCPKCGAEGKLSLVDGNYIGPRRCWKCRELFTIRIENNRVTSSEPLSEDDYRKQQAVKEGKDKLGNFAETSKQEEPDFPRLTPERRRDYSKPLNQGESTTQEGPARQQEPERPAPKTPPDRFRTFVPLEDTGYKEPEKPAPKNPPDRFRTFIPPAT